MVALLFDSLFCKLFYGQPSLKHFWVWFLSIPTCMNQLRFRFMSSSWISLAWDHVKQCAAWRIKSAPQTNSRNQWKKPKYWHFSPYKSRIIRASAGVRKQHLINTMHALWLLGCMIFGWYEGDSQWTTPTCKMSHVMRKALALLSKFSIFSLLSCSQK